MAVICANGVHDSICTNQSDGVQDERRDGGRPERCAARAASIFVRRSTGVREQDVDAGARLLEAR